MEELDEKLDKEYVRGFNAGYTISKFAGDLSERLSKGIQNETAYTSGFNAGKDAYEKERTQERENELRQPSDSDRDKDMNIER